MGVTGLWSVLAPVKKHRTLSYLAGKTLAVDLSIWVCETQCVKQMQGVVTKPYLRNLFFRILYLKQIGIHLIFIIEGEAPELKWDVMQKRLQARHPGKHGTKAAGKQGRTNFKSYLRECCQLLDLLGIPYIHSHGEAEAMCAHLNAAGLVDGCLTDDGDAFLYGARTVYRNFTLNSKDPHVESYSMDDIETQLGIDQYGLVALALLLGCDYLPNGVPGVGVASAKKLMKSLQGFNILSRFQKWRQDSVDFICVDGSEELVRKKALIVEGFPQQEVIDEFLEIKEKCPSKIPNWRRPELALLLEFAMCKLEWPPEYTLEKTLPLITLWDMLDIRTKVSGQYQQQEHLQPEGIVKTRVRQGIPCFEVKWKMLDYIHAAIEAQELVTIETQELFQKCYPEIVQQFQLHQQEQKAVSKMKGKKKKAHCNPESHEVANSNYRKPEESVFDGDNSDVQICTSSQSVTVSEASHTWDEPAFRKARSRKSGSRSGSSAEPVSKKKDVVNKLSPMENDVDTNGKEIFSEAMNLSDLMKRLILNVEIVGQGQQVIADHLDNNNHSDSEDDYLGLPLSQRLIKRTQNAFFEAEKMPNVKPIKSTNKMADDRMWITSDFPRIVPVQSFTSNFPSQKMCETDDDNEYLFSERKETKANTEKLGDFESIKVDSFQNVQPVKPDLNNCNIQGKGCVPEKYEKNVSRNSGNRVANQIESTMLHKVELLLVSPYTVNHCGLSTKSELSNTDCVDECSHEQVNFPNMNDELSVKSVTSIQTAVEGMSALISEEENNDSNFSTSCRKSAPNCSVDLFTSVDSIIQSPVDCLSHNDEINQEHSQLVQTEVDVRTNNYVSHKADNSKRNPDKAEKGSKSTCNISQTWPRILNSCRALQGLNTDKNKMLNSESTKMERSVICLNDSSENLDDNKENVQNKVKRGVLKSKWTEGSKICRDSSSENYHEGRENVPRTLRRDFVRLENGCSENNDKVLCRNVCIDKLVNQGNPNERYLTNSDSVMQFGNFNIETSILNSPCESFKKSDISGLSELDSDFNDDKFQDQSINSSTTAEFFKKHLDSTDKSNFSCKNCGFSAVEAIEKKLLSDVDSIVESPVREDDESIDTQDMGLAERLRRRMKDSKASQVLDILSSQI